jgi:hypothetical protein
MKRYVTLDFLRGLSIFGMIYLHILINIYNMDWTTHSETMRSAPMIALISLMMGLYFGSWAGLFLMVSATSNMISMYRSVDKGKSVQSMVYKQVLGGFILLLFAFLAEGTLQYYAVFQTIVEGAPDFTRILWKGYTMETIHTIAWCMVVNGIVQGLLSIKEGYKKITRNMIIYAVLAIVVVLVTQPLWDWIKTIVPGYPAGQYNPPINQTVQKPAPDATFGEYILLFFLLPLAGTPEPIFPFLAVSFIGSIIGLALCKSPNSRAWPKQGMIVGLFIFVAGILIWIIGDMPFDSLFPMDNFSTFNRIGDGINWLWLPWVCFITGGQVIVVCMMFRLIEFRGKSKAFADKTKFIRIFGIIPFTLYCFHRIFAEVPLLILSLIFKRNLLIDNKVMNGWAANGAIILCILFIYGIIRLWEKKDYIGSLEWMIGTINAYGTGIPKKSQEKIPWYRWGARDHKAMFTDAEWVDVFPEGDNGGVEMRDSKLSFKLAIMGLLVFPFTFITFIMHSDAVKNEGKNKYNDRSKIISIIGLVMLIAVTTVLSILKFGVLGIDL